MFTLNIILAILLFPLFCGLVGKLYQLKKREKALSQVGGELNQTLDNLKTLVHEKRNNKISEKEFLADPTMLATLITVIVTKYGSLQLEPKDFVEVNNGAYISIYVDVEDESLILSTNHDLAQMNPFGATPFGTTDDSTFH